VGSSVDYLVVSVVTPGGGQHPREVEGRSLAALQAFSGVGGAGGGGAREDMRPGWMLGPAEALPRPRVWKLVLTRLSCFPTGFSPAPVMAPPLCSPQHAATPPPHSGPTWCSGLAAAGSAGARGRPGMSRVRGGNESRVLKTTLMLVLLDLGEAGFQTGPYLHSSEF